MAEKVEIELTIKRLSKKQTHHANPLTNQPLQDNCFSFIHWSFYKWAQRKIYISFRNA